MELMTKAIYAGSFDPFTFGHLDIAKRAARFFDEVIIAIGTNTSKTTLFTPEEKYSLIQEVVKEANVENIRVILHTSGLTVELAEKQGAQAMIRGLRSVKDMEYEMDIASMNKTQNQEIETVFLMASEKYRFVSSSMIKEIAHFDGDISEMVPALIAKKMKQKVQK
jgi:pantetheine-phosphate adenylyltransferase